MTSLMHARVQILNQIVRSYMHALIYPMRISILYSQKFSRSKNFAGFKDL